jgi:hypothetical protein
MTMWRPTEPAEDDVSDLPGIDPQSKRRRSRRRVWRDGLADQTVVRTLEDVRSYRAFERTLIGNPRSVIELELVHGLANLLWRLRRARAIETGLLEIRGEFLHASRSASDGGSAQPDTFQTPTRANGSKNVHGPNGGYHPPTGDQGSPLPSTQPLPQRLSNSRAMAQCFLRLSNLDPTLLVRVGAYETRLWRQAAQTIRALDAMRRPPNAPARPRFRKPLARYVWDWDRRIGHSD